MTKYEYYIVKSDECRNKSIIFTQKNEPKLAEFYKNASVGFEKKAKSLTIKEARSLYEC